MDWAKSSRGAPRRAESVLRSPVYLGNSNASGKRSRREIMARIIIADDDPIMVAIVQQSLEKGPRAVNMRTSVHG